MWHEGLTRRKIKSRQKKVKVTTNDDKYCLIAGWAKYSKHEAVISVQISLSLFLQQNFLFQVWIEQHEDPKKLDDRCVRFFLSYDIF